MATPRPQGEGDHVEGSPAIDKGVVLPNIDDCFRGRAPDAGAFELGDPPPHYGPRTKEKGR